MICDSHAATNDIDPSGDPSAVIRGIGVVTPLGLSPDETWDSLLAGRHLKTTGRISEPSILAIPRVCELAIRAARMACDHLSVDDLARDDTWLVVGTSKGPVDRWLEPTQTPLPGVTEHIEQSAYIGEGRVETLGLAEIAVRVASALTIGGARLTVSGACASGLHALVRAAMLIQSGQASRVLVVAAESSLHPLFLACYYRLGVLTSPEVGCRPFDSARAGFFVSEAAAAVLLERSEGSSAAGRNVDVRIERFAVGNDPTHLTGSDRQGRSLRRLLTRVIGTTPLDLVHGHGTGTRINDAVELAAIDAAVGSHNSPPHVYSHKGAIGHTLGASGLVAVVLNCLAHRYGIVPPSPQLADALPAANVLLDRSLVRRPIRRSLVTAAGFGGATAAMTLVSENGGL